MHCPVTGPNRTREVCDLLAEHLWRVSGIRLHTGKTLVWNRSGVSPPNLEVLGDPVWSREGIKVLGTDQFVSDAITERVQEERRLWGAIEWVPELVAGWHIFVQCAAPRCHLLSNAPSQFGQYAALHDAGILRTMKSLLGGLPGEPRAEEDAYRSATRPMRMGRFGLRTATGMAPAATGPSWRTFCARCKGGPPLWPSQLCSSWKQQQNFMVA